MIDTQNASIAAAYKSGFEAAITPPTVCETSDLICFAHLRWDFVFQRPNHLMSRFARHRRVFYIEEPVFDSVTAYLRVSHREDGLRIVTPHLPEQIAPADGHQKMGLLLEEFFEEQTVKGATFWYYTPMALAFTRHLKPACVIYDCMDELSAFRFAPAELVRLEEELLARADVVYTGGHSLFEAKQHRHQNIHPFPSSIDREHFARARAKCDPNPEDQAMIPGPRFGFFGVIDERMDLQLLDGIARLRPNWHFIVIGPVVKIDPSSLPNQTNVHWLGKKAYDELPSYLAFWDVAIMPFARNESTRFISPTKTPEYLAAGRPVVSTSIRDVVRPYSENRLVRIADTAETFVIACEAALKGDRHDSEWLRRVDAFLVNESWDNTWQRMAALERRATRADAQLFQSSTLPANTSLN